MEHIQWDFVLGVGLFLFLLSTIMFEYMDKVLAGFISITLLLILGVISPSEIIPMLDFNTLFLLAAMMMLVEVTKESQLLSWMNIKIIRTTKGNPLMLFFLFGLITFFLSTFLANATTMMVLVPLTIAITRGMGLDPKPYLIAEIVFSDVGGALTLVGDPTNVMIGSANNFSFMDFLKNMSIPIFSVLFIVIIFLAWKYWHVVKPIKADLPKLFMNNLLMEKINYDFAFKAFDKKFAFITSVILAITVFFFVFGLGDIPLSGIAMLGCLLMLIFLQKYVKTHVMLERVDWHMLLFFAALFIHIGVLEKVGALHPISEFIATHATTSLELSLMVLWFIGLMSAFIENIPLVAMMIPVLQDVIGSGVISGNTTIVWYALSMGSCLGGNGSLIGSSANMVVAHLSEKNGVKISFWEYFKVGYVVTIMSLVICSVYLLFVA